MEQHIIGRQTPDSPLVCKIEIPLDCKDVPTLRCFYKAETPDDLDNHYKQHEQWLGNIKTNSLILSLYELIDQQSQDIRRKRRIEQSNALVKAQDWENWENKWAKLKKEWAKIPPCSATDVTNDITEDHDGEVITLNITNTIHHAETRAAYNKAASQRQKSKSTKDATATEPLQKLRPRVPSEEEMKFSEALNKATQDRKRRAEKSATTKPSWDQQQPSTSAEDTTSQQQPRKRSKLATETDEERESRRQRNLQKQRQEQKQKRKEKAAMLQLNELVDQLNEENYQLRKELSAFYHSSVNTARRNKQDNEPSTSKY
jgi:hypothetical protein